MVCLQRYSVRVERALCFWWYLWEERHTRQTFISLHTKKTTKNDSVNLLLHKTTAERKTRLRLWIISTRWSSVHKYHKFWLLNSDNWSCLHQLMSLHGSRIAIKSWAVYLKCCSFLQFPPWDGIDLSRLSFPCVFKLAVAGSDTRQSPRAKTKIHILMYSY